MIGSVRLMHGAVFIVIGTCCVLLGFGWQRFVDGTLSAILKSPLAGGLTHQRALRNFGSIFMWLAGAAVVIDGFLIFLVGP